MDPRSFGSQTKPQSTLCFKTCFLATEPMLQIILEISSTLSLDDVEFPQSKTIPDFSVYTQLFPAHFSFMFYFGMNAAGQEGSKLP